MADHGNGFSSSIVRGEYGNHNHDPVANARYQCFPPLSKKFSPHRSPQPVLNDLPFSAPACQTGASWRLGQTLSFFQILWPKFAQCFDSSCLAAAQVSTIPSCFTAWLGGDLQLVGRMHIKVLSPANTIANLPANTRPRLFAKRKFP